MRRKILFALLAGAVSGTLILGLVGRMAMAVVALAVGAELNLSGRGVVEVATLGAMIGAVGGVVLFAMRKAGKSGRLAHGLMLGIVLFLASVVFESLFGERVYWAWIDYPLTFLTVAAVFIAYGVGVEKLLGWLEGRFAAG